MTRLIAAIATFAMLTPSLALAQPLPQPKPAGPGGSCPHGYTSSGSFCVGAGATAAPNGEGYDLEFNPFDAQARFGRIVEGKGARDFLGCRSPRHPQQAPNGNGGRPVFGGSGRWSGAPASAIHLSVRVPARRTCY